MTFGRTSCCLASFGSPRLPTVLAAFGAWSARHAEEIPRFDNSGLSRAGEATAVTSAITSFVVTTSCESAGAEAGVDGCSAERIVWTATESHHIVL